MDSAPADRALETGIAIRDIVTFEEIRQVEELQKTAWGFEDLDVIPLPMLVAVRELGGILLGAFNSRKLLGFTFGFLGRESGHLILHSQMLAVNPKYRNADLGRRLKIAQRARVLSDGLNRVTWTFDPLQSLNAHLNFAKLGVVCASYRPNFYGESTSSHLHSHGTDRLMVTWLVASDRVARRIESGFDDAALFEQVRATPRLVRAEAGGAPAVDLKTLGAERVVIEIPSSIGSLSAAVASKWRDTTREAFTKALAAGYMIEEFCRAAAPGAYVLIRAKKVEDFE